MLSHKSPYLAEQRTKKNFKDRLQWGVMFGRFSKTINVVILIRKRYNWRDVNHEHTELEHDLAQGNLKPRATKRIRHQCTPNLTRFQYQTFSATELHTSAPPGTRSSQFQISSYLARRHQRHRRNFLHNLVFNSASIYEVGTHTTYTTRSIHPTPQALPHTYDMINEMSFHNNNTDPINATPRLKHSEHGETVASLAQKIFKIQDPKAPEIQAERQVKMPKSSIKFVVHLAIFFIHISCYYHTYTTKFGKKKIVTLSRVIGIITREFYTMKIGFKLVGDNIKVFYKQGWHYRG